MRLSIVTMCFPARRSGHMATRRISNPRSPAKAPAPTPTIVGNRVYTLGSTGILNCLELETGKPVWSKDTVQANQGTVNQWGMSCSPLVVDDLVVVEAGGGNNRSLVAYRAATETSSGAAAPTTRATARRSWQLWRARGKSLSLIPARFPRTILEPAPTCGNIRGRPGNRMFPCPWCSRTIVCWSPAVTGSGSELLRIQKIPGSGLHADRIGNPSG